MPHQCTSCGYLFEDGSKAMLSGCPDCGGNTFQFHPEGAPIPEIPDEEPPEPEGGTVGDTVGRATNAVRGLVNRGDQPAGAPAQPGDVPAQPSDDPEQPGDVPAQFGDAPAQSGDVPDQPADPPDGRDDLDESADTADAETAQQSGSEPVSAETDATTGTSGVSADAVGEGGEDEPAEFGRDADVEHAPWPGEDAAAVDDGASGSATGGAPHGAAEGSPQTGVGDEDIIDADAREGNTSEDAAQASARTEFAGPDELPGSGGGGDAGEAADGGDTATGPPGGPPRNGRVVREPTGEQPSLDELRQELNDQFESIKIVNPGEYELNLMELYNREEYVVALQENGRYVIQMPEHWMQNRDDD